MWRAGRTHVNVIAGGAAAAILPLLSLDGDGLCGADSLTQLARDAALLPRRVAPQQVLAAEARAELSLLKRIIDLPEAQQSRNTERRCSE